MERRIVAYHMDNEGDWVADLDCGHPQHVRHNLPLANRPWASTDEGRQSHLGMVLNCVRCDVLEFPDGYVAFNRTDVFDEQSLPDGLRRAHTIRLGTWAQINVLEGRLKYTVDKPLDREFVLDSSRNGVIVPEVPHQVEPIGPVRFYVEFYKAALNKLG